MKISIHGSSLTAAVFLILFLSISSVFAKTNEGWVKCPDNPVLGGDLGVCFDISMIQQGEVYKMWFSWRTKKSIAYTESRDGIHWSDPKVVLSPVENWEDRINRPGVLFKDGSYHLWYTGQTKDESRIGYAVSSDGIHWTRKQKDPVLVSDRPWEKVAVMCPHVLWDNAKKIFKMWYSGGDQYEPNAIGYAESSDGIHWTKSSHNPIFRSDPKILWEKHKVTAAQILPFKGWYYMFYIGFENEHLARIGIARSKDGIDHWERMPGNPIIGPDSGQWDGDACYKPFVIFDSKKSQWKLWYNGRKGHVEQIGMAVHEGEDLGFSDPVSAVRPAVLDPEKYRHYIDDFNRNDEETVKQIWPNSTAWKFLANNIPFFDYPDKDLEKIYYFRWWTFRKHLKQTADGDFVITEFHPPVSWAGKENTISCPGGHHFREGRWLHNENILNDYARFWLRKGGSPRSYSFWIADSVWQQAKVTGQYKKAVDLLDDLAANYEEWEKTHLDPNGLFWQIDDRDGMECSIGGSGYRATINTYMYADAMAISKIAGCAKRYDLQKKFADKAARLKKLINEKLWDPAGCFYKVAPRVKKEGDPLQLQKVREEHGFTPWYADDASIPPAEYSKAWDQLMNPKGFYAPFGPTTAEQRDPKFEISYQGHECQWNGPSWPFATSITLTALSNLIYRDSLADQKTVSLRKAFRETLSIYAKSHRRIKSDGSAVPWIDENLDPFSGSWIARTRLEAMKWSPKKGGYERGKDYNHSTFCDLIINGLVGIRPLDGNQFDVMPLVDKNIEYFCLDGASIHRHSITVLYDKSGTRYHRGKGFRVLCDGKEALVLEEIPQKPVRIDFDRITPSIPNLETVVDLNVGESQTVSLSNGEKITIKLLDREIERDPAVEAIRSVRIRLSVNGKPAEIFCGNYHRPVLTAGVQLECPAIKELDLEGGSSYYRAIEKDARIRIWPKGSPWIAPGTFCFPIRQKLFLTKTQMNDEHCYVDGGERPGAKKHGYHTSCDFGGTEGMVDIISATDGLVVSAAGNVLDGYDRDPVRKRYDVVYVLDGRGWFYRYSHMKRVDVKAGDQVRMGDQLGILGKEGTSGGWTHLHFGVNVLQPSGKWGENIVWPYVWESYLREYDPDLIAVGRPHKVGIVGTPVLLDGSLCWTKDGKKPAFQWTLSNGQISREEKVRRTYDRPGFYGEILKITDSKGNVSYDCADVQIFAKDPSRDPKKPFLLPPEIHLTYAPDKIKAGDSVCFKVRSFRTEEGGETIDFGDGSEKAKVKSDGNHVSLNPDGYAVVNHVYKKSGTYIVRADHVNKRGEKATAYVFVEVGK
ncbi:MAG: peptidoglycan DD-metalloendopeptidase family protein [Planctomycetia bacterium]|nr:peptidoglycan DD-metalloendopeptidase family protein [Planctomycetia bacterium]